MAMAADGIAALLFGYLYDKKGISVLVMVTAISSLFAPLVFSNGFYSALIGMILWGIGIGSQESIMRAVVAHLVPTEIRGTAYGTMNVWFGLFWFAGSALMGFLYDTSTPLLIAFSLTSQLAAIPLLLSIKTT
jgi:MFS family permease